MTPRKAELAHALDTTEMWESGELGSDVAHAKKVSPREAGAVDAALNLQMISIRLQSSLIDDLKGIAMLEGLVGYQPLIRRVLNRFVDSEKKRILCELANQQAQAKQEQASRTSERPAKHRKAA